MGSGPRAVVVLSLVVLSLLAVTTAGAAVTGDRPPAVTPGAGIQQQTATGSGITQTFVVDLQRDGDARWTVTKTFSLTTEDETAAFGSVAESFEAGETSALGLASYRRAGQLASGATERDMRIANVTRSATRAGETGRLSVSFTWTNFGRLDGDNFYIDDVFATGEGPWFDGLYENQRLVVRPPDGYQFFDAPVPVTLRNGTIQWTGPREFSTRTLSATFERTGTGPTATPTPPTPRPTTEPGTPSVTEGAPAGNSSESLLWVGAVTLGVGAVVVGYLLVRERDLLENPEDPGGGHAETPANGPEPATPQTPAAETADESDEESDDGIDVELLSDEERVERLLEQNGGRMKQANIVKETNWSNAKVSQLLSAMADEGRIDKLRIGRENLISFPDEDITDFEE